MSLIPRSSLFDIDTFFNDSFPAYRLLPEAGGTTNAHLPVDIDETGNSYILKADFPGMNKEDISVSVEGNTLTLSAEHKEENEQKDQGQVVRRERRYGRISRSFNLGRNVDENNISANFENGVLTLEIPKAGQDRTGGKQIPIK